MLARTLIAVSLTAIAAAAPASAAAEEKPYVATLDPVGAGVCADNQGEIRTPVGPPAGLGAACFGLAGRSSVRISILDDVSQAVSYDFAFYTSGGTCVVDGSGVCLRHGCASQTFAVPAGASILEVHPAGVAGAATCFFHGSGVSGLATRGKVRIT